MSGHSKWSTIKRKKGALDAKRGKIFTKLAREIMVAAREGGGEADANPRLRLALDAANAANMPKDNQERAIKKGLGELDAGVTLDEVVYEGRGPSGSVFIVEAVTDNRNRTVAELRHLFGKAGGELGTDGSATWMFERKGIISLPRASIDEDALIERVIEAGGEEIKAEEESWIVLAPANELRRLQAALDDLQPEAAQIQWLAKPEYEVALADEAAVGVAQFWAKLDEQDDVQEVYCNVQIDDAIMAEHGP